MYIYLRLRFDETEARAGLEFATAQLRHERFTTELLRLVFMNEMTLKTVETNAT